MPRSAGVVVPPPRGADSLAASMLRGSYARAGSAAEDREKAQMEERRGADTAADGRAGEIVLFAVVGRDFFGCSFTL